MTSSPTRGNESTLRRGFTLIEVVAALVLLSGTVVALINVESRSLQQLAASTHQRTAARLAEELLAHWQLQECGLCTEADGAFGDCPGWSWRRSVTQTAVTPPTGLLQIELAIIRTDEQGEPQTVATYVWLEAPDE